MLIPKYDISKICPSQNMFVPIYVHSKKFYSEKLFVPKMSAQDLICHKILGWTRFGTNKIWEGQRTDDQTKSYLEVGAPSTKKCTQFLFKLWSVEFVEAPVSISIIVKLSPASIVALDGNWDNFIISLIQPPTHPPPSLYGIKSVISKLSMTETSKANFDLNPIRQWDLLAQFYLSLLSDECFSIVLWPAHQKG